ncbi:MAG: ROK family protein [Prolixibacteraceae bacterium]|jgi:glucokinase|nr:ROK family protein [Prolixibacteraceae bacterium]
MKNIVGIDIGGTKCAVSLGKIDNNGKIEVTDKLVYPTRDYADPYKMLDQLQEGALQLFSKYGLTIDKIESIGISCGGPLDSVRGLILSPPNLPGWDNIPAVELFQQKLEIPMAIQNDANACALAEWKFGTGKGLQNVIFLTFGTGMGAGLILNGKLYAGTNDMAGEVGHIRLENMGPVGYGKAGSFEGFCSGGGIAQLAQIKIREKLQMGESVSFCSSLQQLDSVTAQTVAEAAIKGDPLAAGIYETCGTYMGRALSVLIDILNPEMIILGSIFVRSGDLLISAINRQIEAEALPHSSRVCQIAPAKLGESIGDYAALSVAAYHLENIKQKA